ncbi:MAG: sulfotransferase [Gemmatimonadota bacterium]
MTLPAPTITSGASGRAGLLIVGGPMRGGTSLLHHLLDSHPRVELMDRELRALRYADLATWAHVAAVHQSFTSTIARVHSRRLRRQVYRYIRAIIRGHRMGELATLDRIHDALIDALALADTLYVGDKYPDYVLQYPQFIHRDHTRCVFVHRDPRDVVASILDRVHQGDWAGRQWARRYDTVAKASAYWISIMRALADIRRLETNVLLLSYDSLVLETSVAVASIASHLSVAADGFDSSLPDPSIRGRYRSRLSGHDISEIERLAGDVMAEWGYI